MFRSFLPIFFAILLLPIAQSETEPALLITEIFYDTPGEDGHEEWVELMNVSTAVIGLTNIKIGDEEKAGGSEGMFRFPEGASIAAGEVIVVAQTAVSFNALYGKLPNYEFQDSHPDVPNMRRFPLWASDAFALSNSGDELLLLGERNELLDGLNYGDSRHFFSPAVEDVATGQSIARTPTNCDSNTAADWQPQAQPTPGIVELAGACAAAIPTPQPETLPPIGTIQGNRASSPRLNEQVSFRGIVTGIHADRNASGVTFFTLFVQDLPGQKDGDPTTSDGIAVFVGRRRPIAQLGDQVRVTGQITEFFGLTEVDDNGIDIEIEASGLPLPEPIPLPQTYTDLEHLEGMRVRLAGTAVVVNPTFRSCSFGVSLTDERIFRRASSDTTPPILAILHHREIDGCGDFPHLKTGDRISNLVGPLTYHFDEFKIVQQTPQTLQIDLVPLPAIPAPPIAGVNQFSVASFNVENLFDSVDDTGDDAEPKLTAAALDIKLHKIAHAVVHTLGCPTLIGIQEVENEALLLQLADRLTPDCGLVYQVSHQESADGRGIDVALLSDPRQVTVDAVRLEQTCTGLNTGIADPAIRCPVGQEPLFSRPPLAVDLTIASERYTVLINHFKSKRGGEAETAPRRLAQAMHMNRLVTAQLDANPEAKIIVLGDFNDFERSPSTQAMQVPNGRLYSTLALVPDSERYSFIFGGASQLIDDILVSPTLVNQLVQATIQHSNADFPDAWKNDTSAERLAYRATDHDLPLVILALETVPRDIATSTPLPTATNAPIATSVPPATDIVEERPFPWLWILSGAALVILAGLGLLLREVLD